jgi:benzoyl-CoA-dihydrodiol lyase
MAKARRREARGRPRLFTRSATSAGTQIRVFLEEHEFLVTVASPAGGRFVFGGPGTVERQSARLTAWQNWIFQRPNAVGEEGALRRYGTGQKAVFDTKRV